MKLFQESEISSLLEKARGSERKRAAKPLHSHSYTGTRALLNALLPGTYIQPHRHLKDNELWVVLRGEIFPFSFDNAGNLGEVVGVSSESQLPLIDAPEGEWHGMGVLDPAVILEVVRGPYDPRTYKEFAPWAPTEGDTEGSQEYLAFLESRMRSNL